MAVEKTENQIKIINRVKELRQEKGVSQQQLATLLGVTNDQIGNIESLKYPHKYTLQQLRLIAQHFEIPTETFFLKRGEKELGTEECIERICEYLEN